MSATLSIQEYVARQPHYAWRRHLVRDGLIRTLGFMVLWKMEITGLEHIPADGPAIIMMNHISFIDPILVMGAVTKRFVIPMSKIENGEHPIIGRLERFYGAFNIDRENVDRTALQSAIELLKSGQLVLVAPEGTRQRNGLVSPKDGMAYIATKTNAAIIPTAISGATPWGANLKRLRRTKIQINFGPAFRFKTEGRKHIPRPELTRMMQEAMYQLALALPDKSQRGVYSDMSKLTTDTLVFLPPS